MKEEIIEIATKQMMSGGYEALNFAEIASELNTTRANLHYHFKNKETLASEVIDQYSQIKFDQIKQITEHYQDDIFSMVRAIEEFFWTQAKAINSTSLCVCNQVAKSESVPISLSDMSKCYYENYEQMFKEAITKAQENGQLRRDINPAREATRSHVLIMGVMNAGQHIGVKKAEASMRGLLQEWIDGLK